MNRNNRGNLVNFYSFLVIFAATLFECKAHAQSPSVAASENAPGRNVAGPVSLLSNYEFWLTMSILLFGIMSIAISIRSVKNMRLAHPDQIIRVVAVNIIVIGALVTITAGLSDKQIAPAFGLFGTIAGYLLGRSERDRPAQGSNEQNNKPSEGQS